MRLRLGLLLALCLFCRHVNAWEPEPEGGGTGRLSLAIFLQYGQDRNTDIIFPCLKNIALAKEYLNQHAMDCATQSRIGSSCSYGRIGLDLYATYGESLSAEMRKIEKVKSVKGVDRWFTASHSNEGLDVGPFLRQLKQSIDTGNSYELVFKIHTKSNREWLKYTLDCMCGTPSHVVSIIKQFINNSKLEMIGPQGLTFTTGSDKTKIAPFLVRKLFPRHKKVGLAFQDYVISGMESTYETIFGKQLKLLKEEAVIAAGTVWWARYNALSPRAVSGALNRLQPNFTSGYNRHGGIEHYLERLFPTVIEKFGGLVRDMVPAPKVLMVHDYGTTLDSEEESILFSGSRLSQYYSQHGVYGHAYSYNCFNGIDSKNQLALIDLKEQRMPFILIWTNNPSTSKWPNPYPSIDYGDDSLWTDHFKTLVPVLQHESYITIEGDPIFVIGNGLRLGTKLQPMLQLWRELSQRLLKRRVYFIVSGADDSIESIAEIDAVLQYAPEKLLPYPKDKAFAGLSKLKFLRQFWGIAYPIHTNAKISLDCPDVRRTDYVSENLLFVSSRMLHRNTNDTNMAAILRSVGQATQSISSCPHA